MQIAPLIYRKELFELYKKHSIIRFNNREINEEEFIESFYNRVTNSFQTEYYLNNKLIGCGYLDRSTKALSSVYFFFDPDFEELSPGTFSIIKEIELANSLGLSYYYLGYYIKENHHMAYKNRFKPFDLYDWEKEKWLNY